MSAQRRPGLKPRLHDHSGQPHWMPDQRSTKAGAETPATPFPTSWAARTSDTAQRRPGLKPRLHGVPFPFPDQCLLRSTKAGAETPATRWRWPSSGPAAFAAQRRPGLKPRLHPPMTFRITQSPTAQRRPGLKPRLHGCRCCWCKRTSCRAQRRPGLKPRLHTVKREITPLALGSLNEGRG